jgi:deazaflavin-dependent oxidoreductase (nitroreductase family)
MLMSATAQTPAWRRVIACIFSTPAGTWFGLHIVPPIDRCLLRWSGGRMKVALGQNTCLLETVGARSGAVRSTPLLYIGDGARLVVIASMGGAPRHPAWYHNLRKNPRVTVTLKGRRDTYVAHEAEGVERARLWSMAVDYYPGYAVYAQRAGVRRIPVVVLSPERARRLRTGASRAGSPRSPAPPRH